MILRYPAPELKTVCEPAELGSDETRLIATQLQAELRIHRRKGIGLAAPQIGITKRVFVLDTKFLKLKCSPVFVNPDVFAFGEEETTENEGCLSFSDAVSIPIKRKWRIMLSAHDVDGIKFTADLRGMAARCAAHELDHLNGITLFDHATPAQWKTAMKKVVAKAKGGKR